MKRLLLLTAILLTACGPSQEEKENIATVACNVLTESKTMDDGIKIKEVNQARTQMGESPFLGASSDIKEAINWSLCEELVINNPKYGEILNDAKNKLNNFIEGFWIHKETNEDAYDVNVFTMQFNNDSVELSRYHYGTLVEKAEFSVDWINDSELGLVNTLKVHLMEAWDEHIFEDISEVGISINQENNELRFERFDLAQNLNFTRPQNLQDDFLVGFWSFTMSGRDGKKEQRYKVEITIEETKMNGWFINHEEKTFEVFEETAKSHFDYGFRYGFDLDRDWTAYDFVEETSDGVSNWGVGYFGEPVSMKRVGSNFEIPIPEGYSRK